MPDSPDACLIFYVSGLWVASKETHASSCCYLWVFNQIIRKFLTGKQKLTENCEFDSFLRVWNVEQNLPFRILELSSLHFMQVWMNACNNLIGIAFITVFIACSFECARTSKIIDRSKSSCQNGGITETRNPDPVLWRLRIQALLCFSHGSASQRIPWSIGNFTHSGWCIHRQLWSYPGKHQRSPSFESRWQREMRERRGAKCPQCIDPRKIKLANP